MKRTPLIALLAAAAILPAAVAPAAGKAGNPLAGRKRPADAPPTRITSDRLEFDYQNFVALFDGNVVVTDPEFTNQCDRMLVTFENSNDVKRVDCIGNVDMVSGDIHAKCGKATYTRENALVVMTDDPVVRRGPEQVLSGRIINIWLNDERVTTEGGVSLQAKPNSFKKPAGGGADAEERPAEEPEEKPAANPKKPGKKGEGAAK